MFWGDSGSAEAKCLKGQAASQDMWDAQETLSVPVRLTLSRSRVSMSKRVLLRMAGTALVVSTDRFPSLPEHQSY